MSYLPRHAAPTLEEEWDGEDPMTSLEDRIEAQYAAQDAKRATRAATGRQNRKDLRDSIPRARRFVQANKGYPFGYRPLWMLIAEQTERIEAI